MINFFKEVKAELFKVIWPSKSETLRYTLAVIGFSLGVAAILGVADWAFLKLFEKLIAR